MEADALRTEGLDPIEQRLGEHPSTGALGFLPESRQIPEVLDGLGRGRPLGLHHPSVGLLGVEPPHRRLELRSIAIPAIPGQRRITIAIDPREGHRIRPGLVSAHRGHDVGDELGVRGDVAQCLDHAFDSIRSDPVLA